MGGTITSNCIDCGIPIDVDEHCPKPHDQRCDDCDEDFWGRITKEDAREEARIRYLEYLDYCKGVEKEREEGEDE